MCWSLGRISPAAHFHHPNSFGGDVISTPFPLSTNTSSSMRTPSFPLMYAPGSTVKHIPSFSLSLPPSTTYGASCTSSPSPWPVLWMKYFPRPAFSRWSLAAASTAPTATPERAALIPSSSASSTSEYTLRSSFDSPRQRVRVTSAKYPSNVQEMSKMIPSPRLTFLDDGSPWGSAALGPDWTSRSSTFVAPFSYMTSLALLPSSSSVIPSSTISGNCSNDLLRILAAFFSKAASLSSLTSLSPCRTGSASSNFGEACFISLWRKRKGIFPSTPHLPLGFSSFEAFAIAPSHPCESVHSSISMSAGDLQ